MNRRISARLSVSRGKIFEKRVVAQCEIQGISVVRIPDGCKQAGRRIIRVKSPFDFVFGFGHRAAFIDAKYTSSDRFTYSDLVPHQLKELKKLSGAGVAGYLVCFKTQVWFIDISILLETRPKGHVNMKYAKFLGTITAFDLRRIF